MTRKDKIQHLIISHLLEEGKLELILPNGLKIELETIQNGKNGPKICQDYCSLTATQNNREIEIDSHTLSIKYQDGLGKMIMEDSSEDINGKRMRTLTVV